MANKSPFRLTNDSPDQESQAQLPKRNRKCPGCKSLHGEHSWHILYFVIPALYTVLFFSFWFVTYIMFCLQFCRVSAHAMGLAPLTPSLVLEQKSLFFSIFLASLDLGQIVAVKLQCLNFFVEKKCVIEMYEKGKISCVWIMKWYFKVH